MIGTPIIKVRGTGRVLVPVCAKDGTTGRGRWRERVEEAEGEVVGRGKKESGKGEEGWWREGEKGRCKAGVGRRGGRGGAKLSKEQRSLPACPERMKRLRFLDRCLASHCFPFIFLAGSRGAGDSCVFLGVRIRDGTYNSMP